MPEYYCFECARNNRRVNPVDPAPLSENQYQLDKFIKHTAPTGKHPVNSVFDDPNLATYKSYMVTTANSGCLEIDDRGRSNLIYFAGEKTGLTSGTAGYLSDCSGVKLVCSEDAAKVHAYPSSFAPESQTCKDCGKPVPFDPRTLI